METTHKVAPGQKGSKKLLERYGARLLCVRYCYDAEQGKRFKTVELMIDNYPPKSVWRRIMEDQARPQELLIIVAREHAPKLIEQIRNNHPVTQVGSPRVLVVEAGESAAGALRAMSGLRVVVPGERPPEALEDLDEAERLFVEAWITRMTELRSKKRVGEGLSWDAPGFVPPDRPGRG